MEEEPISYGFNRTRGGTNAENSLGVLSRKDSASIAVAETLGFDANNLHLSVNDATRSSGQNISPKSDPNESQTEKGPLRVRLKPYDIGSSSMHGFDAKPAVMAWFMQDNSVPDECGGHAGGAVARGDG